MIRYATCPLVFFFLIAASARANVYTVGNGCQYASISAAIGAAESNPGPDTIQLSYNRQYDQQAISISTAQQLDIVGGFPDCGVSANDGTHAEISGLSQSVFHITVATGGVVRLSYVTITGGDAQGLGRGGGIYFTGNGTLELHHAEISQNTAGFGGGIYVEATGDATKLQIGEDVQILANTARYDGGGVVNDSATMTMTAPDSYIGGNKAQGLYVDDFHQYGYGGGLLILSGDHQAHTFLGSSGPGSVGTIYLNTATFGGGVAIEGANYPADLNLFSIDPARPVRINGNSAYSTGGGIQLGGAPGELLNIWYAYLEDNIAPEGAAILVTAPQSGMFFNDPSHRPVGSIDCPIGKPCGGINGNLSEDNSSQLSGAIVQISNGNISAHFRRMEFRGNSGAYVFYGSYATGLEMHHVAMTDNTTLLSLISTFGDQSMDGASDIEDSTIAGNSSGNNTVLSLSNVSHREKIHRSIIWQPGYSTLKSNGDAPPDLLDVMVSERSSIDPDGTASVIEQDPRFVDPAHGDYSLRAGSPALDYAASIANDAQDLYSRPRDVDLPVIENFHGMRDLGAIERPTLQPIVLNSDFDKDLQFWNLTNFDVTTWDGTKNNSGASGSGSAHISLTNAGSGVEGVFQCMHLPAPGVYQLNGFGHGTGTMFTAGDIAELTWEFRKSGGENCIAGAPNASNTVTLSNSNSWTRLATPASIAVTAQDWTLTSSITVTLVAVENGSGGSPTNAWFDGITLRIDGDDTIFGNGFDPQ